MSEIDKADVWGAVGMELFRIFHDTTFTTLQFQHFNITAEEYRAKIKRYEKEFGDIFAKIMKEIE